MARSVPGQRRRISSHRLWRLIAGILLALNAPAQSSEPTRPQFEVATVKINLNGGKGGIRATPGRLVVDNLPLRVLMSAAYKIRPSLISGGPSWLDSTSFDIEGKADSPVGADPLFLMLQTLLEDRFELRLHREFRDTPVYTLTIASGGHRLNPANCVPFDPNHLPRQTAPGEPRINYCGRINRSADGALRTMDAEGIGMTDSSGPPLQSITGQLSQILDRTVIDKTALTGIFDFQLKWMPTQSATAPPDGASGPSIFTAVQEQLGLKLNSSRGPVEFLVIEHVEKPSEN